LKLRQKVTSEMAKYIVQFFRQRASIVTWTEE